MAFFRPSSASPPLVVSVVYVITYVLLDWLSFLYPWGPFGITPWNPPTGLSFVLILLFGRRYLPLLYVAPFLADILVRSQGSTFVLAVATAIVIGTGYSLAGIVLLKTGLRLRKPLTSMRDLAVLFAVAVAGAAVVAAGCVAIYWSAGLLTWGEIPLAGLRYWVGDVIGIAVVTPFLLGILTRDRPLRLDWEYLAQMASVALGLFLVFVVGKNQQFQLFYILFLPIVWVAVRSGFEAVTAAILATQLGLIAFVQINAEMATDVAALQALMLVLTFTGLTAGMLVTERRRAELQLRLQQDMQNRLTQLGSMGELASAIAHEINQPLMAAGTYTRLAAEAIASGAPPATAREAAIKAASQVERASEVVRRLRDLIRLGRSERTPVLVERIVGEALELLQPELEGQSITRIEDRISRELPLVMVDMVQVEQVLLNLLRNALEAIREARPSDGLVSIEASSIGRDFVEIRVRDNGPGFPVNPSHAVPQPFNSTKTDGLGIGLSLSRTIVEAHGGQLVLENAAGGALVRFTVPTAKVQR